MARLARKIAKTAGNPVPTWIEPQLCKLVARAPSGSDWVHEVKYDGYRMSARIENGNVKLLTRSGLDWSDKYPETVSALQLLPVKSAILDGELCGVRPDGVTSFALMQTAVDRGATGDLTYYAFDLLHLDGESLMFLPLGDRKARLAELLKGIKGPIQYSEHHEGDGEAFRKAACEHALEGVISKRVDQPYMPGNRGMWVKSKCLNRAEFVIVGWTDPEGSREKLGALLLGYYAPGGRLMYAGRVGTGMTGKTLQMLHTKLTPLAVKDRPLAEKPPKKSRSPLVLSRVQWVKPKLVAEITYLSWEDDGLLRHTVFVGLREDKPAKNVVRERVAGS